ncbi:MAG: hypothetical protein ACREM8_04030, partial [Vulcanimicrobiaceae bacterium]
EYRCGDPAAAARAAGEALAAVAALNRPFLRAGILCNLTAYLVALERYAEARERGREALDLARELGADVRLAIALQHLAAASVLGTAPGRPDGGELAAAAQLVGFADAHLRAIESVRDFTDQRDYDRLVGALRERLGSDALDRHASSGAALSAERAFAVVELL